MCEYFHVFAVFSDSLIHGFIFLCVECSGEYLYKSHDMHYSLSYFFISILL